MKRFAILAAAALLGATSYVNAETVLSGTQMDQVSAGLFGWAYTYGGGVAAGDIDSLSFTYSESGVDVTGVVFTTPTAYSYSESGAGSLGFLGAAAASSAGSYAELGN